MEGVILDREAFMGLAVIPGSRAISILFILSLNQIKRGILIEKFNFILAPHSSLSVSVLAVAREREPLGVGGEPTG